MAITTVSELRTAISNWLESTKVAAVDDDLIAMLEGKLNRVLRTSDMEATVDIVGGVGGTASYTLPADYLSLRSVTSIGKPMVSKAVQIVREGISGTDVAYYAIEGRTLLFAPAIPEGETVTVSYFQAIPALTDGSPTNWLLTKYPDVYLMGSLAQAEIYLANDERVNLLKSALDEAIAELNEAGLQERLGEEGGQPSRTAITSGPTPYSLRTPPQ